MIKLIKWSRINKPLPSQYQDKPQITLVQIIPIFQKKNLLLNFLDTTDYSSSTKARLPLPLASALSPLSLPWSSNSSNSPSPSPSPSPVSALSKSLFLWSTFSNTFFSLFWLWILLARLGFGRRRCRVDGLSFVKLSWESKRVRKQEIVLVYDFSSWWQFFVGITFLEQIPMWFMCR